MFEMMQGSSAAGDANLRPHRFVLADGGACGFCDQAWDGLLWVVEVDGGERFCTVGCYVHDTSAVWAPARESVVVTIEAVYAEKPALWVVDDLVGALLAQVNDDDERPDPVSTGVRVVTADRRFEEPAGVVSGG